MDIQELEERAVEAIAATSNSDVVWAAFREAHPELYTEEYLNSGYWPNKPPQREWDDVRMRFKD